MPSKRLTLEQAEGLRYRSIPVIFLTSHSTRDSNLAPARIATRARKCANRTRYLWRAHIPKRYVDCLFPLPNGWTSVLDWNDTVRALPVPPVSHSRGDAVDESFPHHLCQAISRAHTGEWFPTNDSASHR